MKYLYKRIISVLLLGAMLLSAAACGSDPIVADEDCFEKFMDAICAFDFSTAYSYLAVTSKEMTTPKPEPTEEVPDEIDVGADDDAGSTPLPTNYIESADFVKKYQVIFDGLGVTSVSYEKLSDETDGDAKTVKFSMTYFTEMAGALTNEYEMRLVKEGIKFRVAWTPALIFPEMHWGDVVRVTKVPARRGDILADGELLAETVSLHAVSAKLDEITDRSAFAASVESIPGVPADDTLEKLDKAKNDSVVVAQIDDHRLTADVHEAIDKLEGAELLQDYSTDRLYPKGSLLAHTIGYVGYAEESELEGLNRGRVLTDGLYDTHSIVGKSGLERSFESTLRGKDGLTVTIRDGNGEYVSTVYRKPVEHGSDVHLTIDLSIQERAEDVMDLVLFGEETAGAVIVMEPKSGEVKAMCSYPTYDLNKLAISADVEYFDQLNANKGKPMQNRMTLGLYPPGSAIKSFTAAAALEQGIIDTSFVFTGNIEKDQWKPEPEEFGRWMWPAITRTSVTARKDTDPMNLANCMLYSDNIFFAYLALEMGENNFFDYLKRIGFCQNVPFELSVAKSTLKVKYDSEEYWNTRSIAESGYGQGQMTISPLQLATMYCAFRNGGNIPLPHVMSALYRTDGVEYSAYETFENGTWIEGAVQPKTIEILLPIMKNIMTKGSGGTGQNLNARGVTVAGKTGTAEIGSDKSREISWVVCFRTDIPEEDELLVLVVLEVPNDKHYTGMKFDIARELISMD